MTMQLKLYNTLTREKQAFTPLDPEHVRMYVCGITPYDYAHIGNLRTMVVFDILFRLLKHVYGEKHVAYVRNYTDIDDKIVQRASETGQQPFELAAEYIGIFERDMATFNMLEPTEKPRVSQHMQGIVKMVDELLGRGFAYVTESGDVMFSVPAFEALPNPPHNPFGYIARRTFDKVQARVEEDAEKRDPRDFPVWKANAKSATKMEQAFNPAELGATHPRFDAPGRPGWHIECSVMSEAILGKYYQPGHAALFDIHGGGEDLTFPHHSCEIAQTEALHPTCTMSSVWMHAAFLTVNGTKMSKSLGNFTTVKDALAKYSPEAIRLWFLQTHYRKPVDFSDEALHAAQQRLLRWQRFAEETHPNQNLGNIPLPEKFTETLADDLNTSEALALVEKWENKAEKLAMMNHLGVLPRTPTLEMTAAETEVYAARGKARAAKNWAESDRLRDELKAQGILVEDHKDGTTTWRRA